MLLKHRLFGIVALTPAGAACSAAAGDSPADRGHHRRAAGGRNDVGAPLIPGSDREMNTVLSPAESFEKLKMREYAFNPAAVDKALGWIKKLEASRFGKGN